MFVAVARGWRLSLTFVVGLAASTAAWSADLAPTAQLLPPNVLVYFSVPSCTAMQERFAETGFGQMVNDPAMAAVRAEVMKKFNELSEQAEGELGMPLSDLFAIPTGEAAFAMVQPPGQKLGITVFLNVGDHEEQLQKLLDKAEKQLEEAGDLTRSSEEFEGTEISVWTNENAGPNEPFKAICYFVKDGTLVGASSTELLQAVLVRWDGKHDRTFATDPIYSYILERCPIDGGDDPAATWFVNPIGLFKGAMSAAGPEVAMQSAMVMGFLPVLGLDRLKGMGGVMELATDDYDVFSQTLIYVDQPVTGVLRALVCPPADQTPPKYIPASVSNISGVHWDVLGAYEAVEQTWDFFTAPGSFAKIMDDAAQDPSGPHLHPKADFLDLLTGQIYLIQDFPKGVDLQQQRMAFIFGVKDQRKMESVIEKVTHLEGVDVNVREFQGIKIYEPRNVASPQVTPAIAVANDALVFSANVELLEKLLRGNGEESLAASEDFKAVAAEFPGPVSTFSFQRQDQVMEAVYDMLKQGLVDSDEFDASTLPDFEALRKYFGLNGSYSVPDAKGVKMVSFSLGMEE